MSAISDHFVGEVAVPKLLALFFGLLILSSTSAFADPRLASTQLAPYTVDGFALGAQLHIESEAYKQYTCSPSDKFPGFTWCHKEQTKKEKHNEITLSNSILHAPDGTAWYLNKYIEPTVLDPDDLQNEINRLSTKFGQPPVIIRMPHHEGLPDALMALWGSIQLEQLAADDVARIASGGTSAGILVSYLGDLQKSAKAGAPVYRLAGGAGFLWVATFNRDGRGVLRFLAADASKYEPSQIAEHQSVPQPSSFPQATRSAESKRENSSATAEQNLNDSQEAPITDCDTYTASRQSPQRGAGDGSTLKINADLAISTCEAAVRQFPNSSRLTYQLGRAYYGAKNYDAALTQFRKAADRGYAAGQALLGAMYGNGQAVQQDYAQAVAWSRKAADQGLALAQTNLGIMNEKGQGVPQDYTQALAWYRKAADQGYATAQFGLGTMYQSGEGSPQDYAQAVAWYRKAADQGYAAAQSNLGIMFERGQGVPQDYTQAVDWYRKAADRGNAVAQNNLGIMYEEGRGVPQDNTQAAEWYQKAADGGSTSAKENLARLRILPASGLPNPPPQQPPTQLRQPQTQETIAIADARDQSPAALDSEQSRPSSVEQSRSNEQSGLEQRRSTKIDDFVKAVFLLALICFACGAVILIKIGTPKLPVWRRLAEQSLNYVAKHWKSVSQRARDLTLGSVVPIIKELMSRDWFVRSTPQSERDVEQKKNKVLSDQQFEALLAKIVSDEYAVAKDADHPDAQDPEAPLATSHQSPTSSEDKAKSQEKFDLRILNGPQGAIVDHLGHLAKLHASGALSDEEFKALKTRLIFQMDDGRVGPFCGRRIDYGDGP
jgi:TPR repeat protein